jgi:hypothetical protein
MIKEKQRLKGVNMTTMQHQFFVTKRAISMLERWTQAA